MSAVPTLGSWLDVAAIRALVVMVPVIVAALLWWAVPDVRRRGAAVLALLWNLIGLTTVNAVAVAAGWWSFGTSGATLFGLPVDVVLGWAVLWSLVPVLAARWVPTLYAVIGLVVLDLFVMPMLAPAVRLAPQWWIGEVLAVGACLIPGMLLAWMTTDRRWLRVRVAMQVVLFAALLLVAIPAVAIELAGRSFAQVWSGVGGAVDVVVVQLIGLVALVALVAVMEFARHGGTPYPWDPPSRLVTSGPYAYVANPMQLCGTVILLLLAWMLWLPALAGAAVVAAAFSSGLAAYVENDSLGTRFGDSWAAYRKQVRAWWPRWRPIESEVPRRVYLARGCDPCSDLAAWIVERRPIGLEVLDAEDYGKPLRRMRYESSVIRYDGVRAFGMAVTHLNLVWAVVGWIVALPGIGHALQVLVDAAGGGPWEVVREAG
ncbi:methyltransferase [Gordonia sp. CPCC 205515]|uniref:methyltransferase family protein n=1 Tax=Gordonia sp. CPCC 205515 TaxID=3140791 RepID=UPI003AF33D48